MIISFTLLRSIRKGIKLLFASENIPSAWIVTATEKMSQPIYDLNKTTADNICNLCDVLIDLFTRRSFVMVTSYEVVGKIDYNIKEVFVCQECYYNNRWQY